MGVAGLSSEEGLELFDRAVVGSEALVVPVRMDTAVLRAQARAGVVLPLLRGLVRIPPRRAREDSGSLARRLAGVPQEDRQRVVLEVVRTEVAVVLGHSSPGAIGEQRAFKDLGFDSLTAVELRNRLNTTTGLQLPATLIFDYPTLAAATGYLLEKTAGSQEATAASLDVELDKLELSLASIAENDSERTRVTRRLQTFLSQLDDPTEEDIAAEDDLRSATDDEIFGLIDRELGVLEEVDHRDL
jgi:acyl carrier protein